MDLAAELRKRLEYRQKVAEELAALDIELQGVIRLVVPNDDPTKFMGTGETNGRDRHEPAFTTANVTPVPKKKPGRRPAVQGVTQDQMEAYLTKRSDKTIDVDALVARFAMKRSSATTRLWNLAHAGRIVKTGPGVYYVPATRPSGTLGDDAPL